MWKFFNKSQFLKEQSKEDNKRNTDEVNQVDVNENIEYLCWIKEVALELSLRSKSKKTNNSNKD